MKLKLKPSVRNAIMIGSLCSMSYLAVYIARNILSAVTPQMIQGLVFGTAAETTAFIGRIASVYFISYATGQLINGLIGDKIKARYMISFGLGLAAVTNFLFSHMAGNPAAAMVIYAMTGFFLAMIYGPMTKVVAENVEPIYATRCSLGYTFASFFGTPSAGLLAACLTWQSVFLASSTVLMTMAVLVFSFFLLFERKGIVRYGQYKTVKSQGNGIRVLIKHRIITFSLIAILTGIVRTAVVFWMPTYISQHLGFSTERSAILFTGATFIISLTTFISVFIYERLKRNMELTIFLMFSASTIFFLLVYLVKEPMVNLALLVLAVMSNGGAASMLWSRYCPSLRDTGMVSSATGFLDFLSYMAASVSSTLFADAVGTIGWSNLILVWMGLMICGVLVALPWYKLRNRSA